jgi:hypothetical protein
MYKVGRVRGTDVQGYLVVIGRYIQRIDSEKRRVKVCKAVERYCESNIATVIRITESALEVTKSLDSRFELMSILARA